MHNRRSAYCRIGARLSLLVLCLLPAKLAGEENTSMTFDVEVKDYRDIDLGLYQTIYAVGDIEDYTVEAFKAVVERNQILPGATIYLHSAGGNLLEAIELGNYFREQGFETYIGQRPLTEDGASEPGECYSACAIAFLGGQFRYMSENSLYGVHRFYFTEEIEQAGDYAQVLSGALLNYVTTMGVDPKLLEIMSATSSNTLSVLERSELEALRVLTTPQSETVWELTAFSEGVYLRGISNSPTGQHKVLFVCDPRRSQIGMLGMYYVGSKERGEEIVSFTQDPALMLNGTALPFENKDSVKVSVDKSYIVVQAVLSESEVEKILASTSVGAGLLPPSQYIYYGFNMEFLNGRDLLPGLASGCK